MYKFITAQSFPMQSISDTLDPLLNLYQSEAEDAARKTIEQKFNAEHPEQDIAERIKSAEQQYQGRAAQTKHLENETVKTPPKNVTKIKDSDHTPTFLDRCFGGLVFGMVFIGFLIIPLLNTGLIIQSQKIPIVADFPVVGLALGIMALVGFVASIEYREKLTTIEGIRLYDRRVIGVSLILFIIWITLAAIIAYPFEVAAPAGLTDEYGDPVTTVEVSPPTAFLFIVTGLLDLCAGPVFHMAAARCLFPRTILVEKDNAYFKALQDDLLPKAYEAQDRTAQMLAELRSWPTQREAAREAFIETELARFRRRRTKALAARHAAVGAFLDESEATGAPTETPRTPSNGALTTSHPNGQFS